MDICLIMDNPETRRHPVIAVVLQKLSARHAVRLLDVRLLSGDQAIALENAQPLADLYLLKSHTPQALELAHYLEQRGARVVNSWASSVACQNRLLMSERMEQAGLPWPRTQYYLSLAQLLHDSDALATLVFPLIIKSRYNHRGDLVGKIASLAELQAFSPAWGQESIVLQEFMANDGWDIKLWAVEEQVFAARRRTPLAPGASKQNIPLTADELPATWVQLATEVGRTFNLRIYGVDLLLTEQGPVIVDVNSFPGFQGAPGADDVLVAWIERFLQAPKQEGQTQT